MSKLAKALTAAAGNAGGESLYVEDVFSTYLYTGTGATQSITNGIDLDGEGGLVWIKNRDGTATEKDHQLIDSQQSDFGYYLESNNSNAANALSNILYPQSDGFNLNTYNRVNQLDKTYASWTFRKAEKFFDVVTYTGNGTTQAISHNLGATIGSIIIKRTDSAFDWKVYHRSLGTSQELELNQTAAAASTGGTVTAVSSSSFTVGGGTGVNASGGSYVAYLFAHDAGGFGDDGSESIIKCGSYTGNGSTDGPTVTLGFEPQWLIIKRSDAAGTNWQIIDVMRGAATVDSDGSAILQANLSNAESTTNPGGTYLWPTSTGFKIKSTDGEVNSNTYNYIYIAIRRPMKTPESGTEVFAIGQGDGDADIPDYISNFPVDAAITKRTSAGNNGRMSSRLTGANYLSPNLTQAESADGAATFDFMNGWGSDGANRNTDEYAWMFKRATGFFDVVAYTGTGSVQTLNHNLNATPKLAIAKSRDDATNWWVYHSDLGDTKYLRLNLTNAVGTVPSNYIWGTTWSDTEFSVGTYSGINNSAGYGYICYLFGDVSGVSKVGSYTGSNNVGSQTIDCGFSTGARFVLIKNTGIGEWFVFDVERGITVGSTDGVLQLQSTSQEYTEAAWGGGDMIQPHPSGFTLTTNGQLNSYTSTYIFLAIA